jgi:hypothetical protein
MCIRHRTGDSIKIQFPLKKQPLRKGDRQLRRCHRPATAVKLLQMLPVAPKTLLIRNWIRRFLIAWLLTPLLIMLCNVLALRIHYVLIMPIILVLAFWPAFLARAAIELAPRRGYVFLVLPALALTIAVVTLGTITAITVAAERYTGHSRPFIQQFLDGVPASAYTGIFVGIFTTGIWLIMPRDKPTPNFYHCAKCGYQLQGSLHSSRCPECGHALELGLDYPYLPHHLKALETLTHPTAEDADE